MLPQRKSPESRRVLRVEVVRTTRTSAHFVTVTFGGPDLADFTSMGYDQWCRFFFRREGQRELRLPSSSGSRWLAQCLLMSTATRPWIRNYTVRAFRPELLELDVEFVVHGDTGPGSAFALRAAPGDEAALLDEGIAYLPPAGVRQLIVADESAVPAALAILECAPDDLAATVLLEVPSSGDIRDVEAPPGVEVRWLPRENHGAGLRPGALALDALTEADVPEGPHYAWICGESGLATGGRRHLNRERNVPKSSISFVGYWRAGRSAPG